MNKIKLSLKKVDTIDDHKIICEYCGEKFRHKCNYYTHKKKSCRKIIVPNPMIKNDIVNNGDMSIGSKIANVEHNEGTIDQSTTNITNITNITINNPPIKREYYFNGKDLYDIAATKNGKKWAFNYLMYEILNLTDLLEPIINLLVDPADGISPLDLHDSKTIIMKISENENVHDSDGIELEKRSRMLLENACITANHHNNCNTELLAENVKYTNLAEETEDEKLKETYEKKAQDALNKILDGTDSLSSAALLHEVLQRIKKLKSATKLKKLLRHKIGERCIKEGKIVPGMKVSLD
jgi:hypothetical protein